MKYLNMDKVNNVKIGNEYKNMSVFMRSLIDIKLPNGNTRAAVEKEIKSCFVWENDGRKIIIKGIIENPIMPTKQTGNHKDKWVSLYSNIILNYKWAEIITRKKILQEVLCIYTIDSSIKLTQEEKKFVDDLNEKIFNGFHSALDKLSKENKVCYSYNIYYKIDENGKQHIADEKDVETINQIAIEVAKELGMKLSYYCYKKKRFLDNLVSRQNEAGYFHVFRGYEIRIISLDENKNNIICDTKKEIRTRLYEFFKEKKGTKKGFGTKKKYNNEDIDRIFNMIFCEEIVNNRT